MKEQVNRVCEFLDHHVTRRFAGPAPLKEGEGEVVPFLFHRLFTDEELNEDIYLHERVTVTLFDRFVGHCRVLGYGFITPSEVLRGQHVGKRSVMITFDDGYADNLRALPILERHDAKATFFLSPAHISGHRRFWWDALHAQGVRSFSEYQEMPFGEARSSIEGRWPGAFQPAGELDRAMSLDEFMTLAASDRVEIGHHSFNHTVLAGRSREYVVAEIEQANAFFQHHLGFKPEAIAYPNGVYTDTLVDLCVEQGLRVGLTCDFRSERLSRNPGVERLMRLGRVMVSGTRPLLPQVSAATLQPSVKRGLYDLKRALR